MNSIFGISPNELESAKEMFSTIFDDDERIFMYSNDTFTHEEDEYSFDYKYCIVVDKYDSKCLVSLNLVVSPHSLSEKCLKAIMDEFERDGVENVDYFDVNVYGGHSVIFAYETFDEEYFNANKDEILNMVASVYGVMDSLRGFYLDKPINRIGTMGWNVVEHSVNGTKLFNF